MIKRMFSCIACLALIFFGAISSDVNARTVSLEGYINILVNEDSSHDLSYSFVDANTGKDYELIFNNDAPRKAINILVKLEGERTKRRIIVSNYELIGSKKRKLYSSSKEEAQGNQKVNAFIVNDPNFATPLSVYMNLESIQDIVFGKNTGSLNDYVKEISKNKMSITGSVYYLNIENACSDSTSFVDRATQVLNYLEENLPAALDMERMILYTHSGCSGDPAGGRGSLGKYKLYSENLNQYSVSISTNYSTSREVTFHEFGHNLGLPHDNYSVCGSKILTSDCVPSLEYGGHFNMMGVTFYDHTSFNSINKYDLGWLETSELINLDSNEAINAEFTLYSLNAGNTLTKTLRIKRKTGDYFFLEYRLPKGLEGDPHSYSNYNFDGALIYLNNDSYQKTSLLLDPLLVDWSDELVYSDVYGYLVKEGSGLHHHITSSSVIESIFYDPESDLKIIPFDVTDETCTVIVQANVNEVSDLVLDFDASQQSIGSKSFNFSINVDASRVKKYSWNFGDGSSSSEASPSHRFTKAGDIEVTLTVLDTDNLIVTKTKTITVPNDAPFVDFSFNPSKPKSGEKVSFSSSSVDADGSVSSLLWDYGDGSNPVSSSSHRYAECGPYNVTLTATDNLGASSSKTKEVFVEGLLCSSEWELKSSTEKYLETISDRDFEGFLTFEDYDFTLYRRDLSTLSPNRSDIVKYEWDLDNDGVFEISNDYEYSQNLLFVENGTETIKLKITTSSNETFILSKNIELNEGATVDKVYKGTTINDANGDVIALRKKKPTLIELSIANNGVYSFGIIVQSPDEYKRILKVKNKKKKKIRPAYVANGTEKTIKVKIAPWKKIKKIFEPNSDGKYVFYLEYYRDGYPNQKKQIPITLTAP